MQLFADGLPELSAPLGGAVHVLVQVLEALFPFQLQNGGAGNEFVFGVGPGEIQVFTGIEDGGAGGADVYILGPVLIKEIHGLSQLGAPNDGVVHKQELLVPNQLVHRDLLHLRHHVPLALVRGHEAPGPGGRILDKGPGEGHAALVGVANGVGGAGVRNAAHIVQVLGNAVFFVGLGHDPAIAIAHDLYVLALVAGGRIAVVGPKEGTDLFLVSGRGKHRVSVGGKLHHLSGAQFPVVFVAQLLTGVVLKGNTAAVGVLFQDDGDPAQLVPGGNELAVVLQDQDGGSALDHILSKTNALRKAAFLVDESGDQLVGVDLSSAHGFEMAAAEGQILPKQSLGVMNDANGANGVGTQLGPDEQGLGVGVGDAADGGAALHLP